MKAASVKELKIELSTKSNKNLVDICLTLSKFKKENKELLSYLLYEAQDEESYVKSVEREVDDAFEEINTRNFYYFKKGVRKILRMVKKYIRYSKKKETEATLLIYFCKKLQSEYPAYKRSTSLKNLFTRQIGMAKKAIAKLHEDLHFDFVEELKELTN